MKFTQILRLAPILEPRSPLNIHNQVEYDPISQQYIFSSYIGDSLIYRYSSSMTMEEYFEYQNSQSIDNFWQEIAFERATYLSQLGLNCLK